jgi:sulfide:quinone oxidoreductase
LCESAAIRVAVLGAARTTSVWSVIAIPGFEVVVCGGGIAGVEGLLRLRRLAGDRVRLTLVSPDPDLVYRPLAVQEPFALSGVRRYPLERVAADVGARWVPDGVCSVDHANRTVHTGDGATLRYDALLLAIGARESSPYEHAQMFTDRDVGEIFRAVVQDIEMGFVNSVAFVVPHEWVWPLPLYELALMTAVRARSLNLKPQITFITSEGRPLKAFGQAAGEAVMGLLQKAGIRLHAGVVARVPAPQVLRFDGIQLEAERIVTLPKITGPAIRGIPAGARWFVPIDEWCVVPSTEGRVFAAGDATDFPVKHGGIGAQQADTAAAGIAHIAGLGDRPSALHPVIQGMLLTGERPLYLAARVTAGLGWQSEVYEQPPWPPQEKIVAEELGPYLRRLDPHLRRLDPHLRGLDPGAPARP